MTSAEIETNLAHIQEQLAVQVGIESPTCILEKLNNLTNLLGMSAEVLAWSEKIYNEKLMEVTLMKQYKDLSATDKKMVFAGILSNEILQHTKAERLNKALTHSIDGLRSMLSFLKEEVKRIG
jgi:16S rRNA C1402 (ribose-2'-O) methylase RsmI